MRSHLHAYARRIYATSFPYRYWTLSLLALSSSLHASYAISVRQASALPAASFRFHLAMDTLAVRLTIPPVGLVEDFHLQVSAPCRAHRQKNRALGALFFFVKRSGTRFCDSDSQWCSGVRRVAHPFTAAL